MRNEQARVTAQSITMTGERGRMRLLALKVHKVSNRFKNSGDIVAVKSQVVYTCNSDIEVATQSARKIVLSCACVNEP